MPAPIVGRPRAIIFDWDNTLVDTWGVIHDALNATLRAFGHAPWSPDEARRRVRKSMRDSFPLLFGDRWEEASRVFYDSYKAIHLEKLTPLPGAEDVLRALKEEGLYLAVVSNKRGEHLRTEAAHLGWKPYFGRLVGASDATRDKPACEPVDLALAGSGIDRNGGVWFAGDADIDLECARNSNLVPVLVRDTPPDPGEFQAYPPAHHVADLQALAALIKSL